MFVLAVQFSGTLRFTDNSIGFGGDCGGVTPVPIPNTEVKPSSADGTWSETAWESRSPPDFSQKGAPHGLPSSRSAGDTLRAAWPTTLDLPPVGPIVGRARHGSNGRDASRRGKQPVRRGKGRIPPPPVLREEVRVERVEADDPAPRGAKRKKRTQLNVDVTGVDFGAVPSETARKLERRLVEAAIAFDAERFTEAISLLDSIDRLAPGVAEVYELRALASYRLGRWMKAIADLERFHELTGSVEQHPVWADCCRALRRWTRAEELWAELGDASPSAELVEEGRLVHAGGLADRGRIDDAIRLLERAPRVPKRPAIHHLRRWYLLADLYERSGDLAHARRVFGDISAADRQFGDVAERLTALG